MQKSATKFLQTKFSNVLKGLGGIKNDCCSLRSFYPLVPNTGLDLWFICRIFHLKKQLKKADRKCCDPGAWKEGRRCRVGEPTQAATHLAWKAGGNVWQCISCPLGARSLSCMQGSPKKKGNRERKGSPHRNRHWGNSDHLIILGKKPVLRYNTSLRGSPGLVSAGGAAEQNTRLAEGFEQTTLL